MSVWREVQERLYRRFVDAVGIDPSRYCFEDEEFDPPASGAWVRFSVKSALSSQRTLGPPGARRFERGARVYGQTFRPPGDGVGEQSDLAERIREAFEGCRFEPHDIVFAAVDIKPGVLVDDGRWTMVTVEAAFDYEHRR